MNEEIKQTLVTAAECLIDAQTMNKQKRWKAAVSRAYYTIYHSARAVLITVDSKAFTHQGVNIEFSKHFIKPGIFEKSLIRTFSKMLDARQKSDYEIGFNASEEDAVHAVTEAENFYKIIYNYLHNN